MDDKGEIRRRIYLLDPNSIQLFILNNLALEFTKFIIYSSYKILLCKFYMKNILSRNIHFLGSKIRAQRKSLNLTLEDLSIRCIQINPDIAPSISYLSLIETGNRTPSIQLLKMLSEIFQKKVSWFLDNSKDVKKSRDNSLKYSFEKIEFEPNFLFSKNLMRSAMPSLLSQAGMSGRQFAHILIRAYQEKNYNQFPDIERTADEVGKKKLPLRDNDVLSIAKKVGLKIKWFSRSAFVTKNDYGLKINSVLRSFYGEKNTVYMNDLLRSSNRLKYDLALYIGHKILHNGDGLISSHASGGELGGSPSLNQNNSDSINQKDILYAWRDFECSFFAGALLCPKTSLKRYLSANAYDILSYKKLEVTPSILMRRMTVVSPYKYWHYFDAYAPGYLRALYRADGIKMPWSNVRVKSNPFKHWNVYKMLGQRGMLKPLPLITILKDKNKTYLNSSISMRVKDASETSHVLCLGLNLENALKKQMSNYDDFISDLERISEPRGLNQSTKRVYKKEITKLSRVLNIKWIAEALENNIDVTYIHKQKDVKADKAVDSEISWINDIKNDVIKSK